MSKQIKNLLKKLSHKDPAIRRSAAEDLSQGDERAVYPLIKALNDPNAGVQDAAMRSLISIGGETTAYMVLPLLREGTFIRNTALIILTSIGESVVPLIYNLLKDKDDDVRKFGLDLMSDIRTGVDVKQVVPMLEDSNANVRAAAAKAIGLLNYTAAEPQLIQALNDEEWVCFSVLEALGEMRSEQAVPAIGALLNLNTSPAVRYVAIEVLGKIGNPKANSFLMSFLTYADSDETNAVIKSMIQIGITPDMADLTEHLIAMLKKDDDEDLEIALRGIADLNCKTAVKHLINLAGSLDISILGNEEKIHQIMSVIKTIDSEDELLKILDDSEMKYRGRSLTISLLGELKSSKAVPGILKNLKDTSRDMRRASAKALGDIGAKESIGSLLNASQSDPDAHVRKAAIQALGNIGTNKAFEPLLSLIEFEKYFDVKEEIVRALLKIDEKSYMDNFFSYNNSIKEITAGIIKDMDMLVRLAEDNDESVKIAAVKGMGAVGGQQAAEKLISFLSDPNPEIRKTAVSGLGSAGYFPQELMSALDDEDQWVRFYAVKSISQVCDDKEQLIYLLNRLLADDFVPVVMSVIDVIRDIGGAEAYEALNKFADHPNDDIKQKIREALDTI
ncbi:MAG: HEAT repeat domain-containing protein [Dissulfurispiraceae bacterium]|jgi:HEAT repeat protein|nr:HEAT repeat domain-containing protein [Dissulfurispiraceae bacterium]